MKIRRRGNDPDFWRLARSFLHDYLPLTRNLSKRTAETYKQSLNCFLAFLKEALGVERNLVCFEHMKRDVLKEYVAWMQEARSYSVKTINLRLTSVKSFLRYCSEEDPALVDIYNGARSIRGLKDEKKPVRYLTQAATTALLRASGTARAKDRRNTVLLIMMYDSAARVQELCRIRLCDLRLCARSPFVTLVGKGRKSRNVPLMGKTVDHLEGYLKEFHPKWPNCDASRPLFYSIRDGSPHALSTDSVSLILRRGADSARRQCAEVPEDMHCHLIRKTRAMDLYQQGIPLPLIMQMLGHESMSTTSAFYAFATLEMMSEAINGSSPQAAAVEPTWQNKRCLDALYSLD
jgi:site-specific recombinase XerD